MSQIIPTTWYGMTADEAAERVKGLGIPAFRAKQLMEWIYSKHITAWDEAKNLPQDIRAKLAESAPLTALQVDEIHRSSDGESTKFLFRTHDNHLLETVLISQRERETVCVSSQLGCKIGCIFCASGKGAFLRNLSAGEVVEQVARVSRETGRKITNIVFMGMGEPLDNFDVTMKALQILQAEWGFGMSARRITVSSSGITPKIVEFVKSQEGRVRLSISLHSSQEANRTYLVPINKKYSLAELVDTLEYLNRTLKRDITFEYTLIDGINDSKEEAEGVAAIAERLSAKVNIIPYNPIREMDFKRPSGNRISFFAEILRKRGLRVIIRQTAGGDIAAACGQLRLDREKTA